MDFNSRFDSRGAYGAYGVGGGLEVLDVMRLVDGKRKGR